MATKKDLIKRLDIITQNNCVIIDTYPEHAAKWKVKLKEIKGLSVTKLEAEVIKLEGVNTNLNNARTEKEISDENKKNNAIAKLETLGITREELILIIKG